MKHKTNTEVFGDMFNNPVVPVSNIESAAEGSPTSEAGAADVRGAILPEPLPKKEKRVSFTVHMKESTNRALEDYLKKSGYSKSGLIEYMLDKAFAPKK